MHKHDYNFAASLRHGKFGTLISMYAHVLIYYSLPGPASVRMLVHPQQLLHG